jgi:hypothetical protein
MNNINILPSGGEDANYVRYEIIKFNSNHAPDGRYEEVNL